VLSAKEGKTYRLPTEAQWEYACRAGTQTNYSFGDDAGGLGEYGWFGGNSQLQTHPVGQKKPNAWGLYDVYGNVWEWCADWYGSAYYGDVGQVGNLPHAPADDPIGPSSGADRVIRGGAWGCFATTTRSARRSGDQPGARRHDLGFRVARDVTPSPLRARPAETGTVRIELSEPQAQVQVKVDGSVVDAAKLNEGLALPPGDHRIEVTSGEFEDHSSSFTVRAGEEQVVRVPLKRKPPPAEKGPIAAETTGPAQRIGRLVSTREVLLNFVPQSGVGHRLPAQANLYSGDSLLSLSAFRPAIALAGQVKVQLIDGTSVKLLPSDAERVSGLAIDYGRILLKAEEAGGARFRLQVGQRTALVTLRNAESILGAEARRRAVPGADPETQPGPMIADLYITSGQIRWQEEVGQPPVVFDAPMHRVWGERPTEPNATQQFPQWLYSDTTNPLDLRAAAILKRELSSGRPANLVLRGLVDFRTKEVRSLAGRSLALLRDFEPLVRALDDPDQKLYWDDSIGQLRAGVMRGPFSAAAVRSTRERFFGAEASGLYEMLWKYSPSLSNAEARLLTDYLDHQTLAVRVLAFWNLKNTYGGTTFRYRPEDPPAKRQAAVEAWKKRLKTPR